MTAALDTLALLEHLAPQWGKPRIRGLHLPPDPRRTAIGQAPGQATGHRSAQASDQPPKGGRPGPRKGEFAALELDDGALGLCYVLLDDTLAALHDGDFGASLPGTDALELARGLRRHTGAAGGPGRALAWAAAQALGHRWMHLAGWQPPPATDSLAALALQASDHLGLVGLFGPLMARLVRSGARITVLELRRELAGAYDGYTVTTDPTALRGCSHLLATGTLLLNDTLDAVLAQTPQARVKALIGPTLGGLPDALFARGIDTVGGTWIADAPAFVDALRSGRERGASARKFTLRHADWPGAHLLGARGRRGD